jgi:DNA-binding NtrC family response regulator
LRTIELMPLKDRAADVPAIFDHILSEALSREKIEDDNIPRCIDSDHYEALCLDGFESNNVRGIVDLVDRLVTGIRFSRDPVETINEIFHKRFADGPVSRSRNTIGRRAASALSTSSSVTVTVGNTSALASAKKDRGAVGVSHYEMNKEQIIKTYAESGGNLTITEALLKEKGLSCSRHWLSIFLDTWGMKKTKS